MITTFTLGSNASFAERIRYGETLDIHDLADTLEALEALESLQAALDDVGLTTDNAKTLASELDALQTDSRSLNDLLDCTNFATGIQLELAHAELKRYQEVCEAFDISSPEALGEALQCLDDLRR